jgi:hypothetical protein
MPIHRKVLLALWPRRSHTGISFRPEQFAGDKPHRVTGKWIDRFDELVSDFVDPWICFRRSSSRI